MRSPISTNKKLGVVVHTCQPSYTGSINRRTTESVNRRTVGINMTAYLKNNESKMGWGCGSSGSSSEHRP
jgi:hypothetical protein